MVLTARLIRRRAWRPPNLQQPCREITESAARIQTNSHSIHVRLRDPDVTSDLDLAWKRQGRVGQVFVGTEPYGVLGLPFAIGSRARVRLHGRTIPFPAMQRRKLFRRACRELERQPAMQEQVTGRFDHPGQRGEKLAMLRWDRSLQLFQITGPVLLIMIRPATEVAEERLFVVIRCPCRSAMAMIG